MNQKKLLMKEKFLVLIVQFLTRIKKKKKKKRINLLFLSKYHTMKYNENN